MIYCERCNGYGSLYIKNGDDNFDCPDCHGTGEVAATRPPFHYSTPQDIVRICHYGLQVMAGITDEQYAEALSQLEAARPTWSVAVYPMQYTVQTFEEWDLEQAKNDHDVIRNKTYGKWSLELSEVYSIRRGDGGV